MAGTKGLRDIARWPQLALRDAEHIPRYAVAMEELARHPDVVALSGHSLGASVVARMNELHPGRFRKVHLFGAPRFFARNEPNEQSHSHLFDPVSAFDTAAEHNVFAGNPHSYDGF